MFKKRMEKIERGLCEIEAEKDIKQGLDNLAVEFITAAVNIKKATKCFTRPLAVSDIPACYQGENIERVVSDAKLTLQRYFWSQLNIFWYQSAFHYVIY